MCKQKICENTKTAQSAGTVECFNCISAEDKTPLNECPGYDIKPSNGEASVLEFWGTWSTILLLLLPGSVWPGVVAPDRKYLWVE